MKREVYFDLGNRILVFNFEVQSKDTQLLELINYEFMNYVNSFMKITIFILFVIFFLIIILKHYNDRKYWINLDITSIEKEKFGDHLFLDNLKENLKSQQEKVKYENYESQKIKITRNYGLKELMVNPLNKAQIKKAQTAELKDKAILNLPSAGDEDIINNEDSKRKGSENAKDVADKKIKKPKKKKRTRDVEKPIHSAELENILEPIKNEDNLKVSNQNERKPTESSTHSIIKHDQISSVKKKKSGSFNDKSMDQPPKLENLLKDPENAFKPDKKIENLVEKNQIDSIKAIYPEQTIPHEKSHAKLESMIPEGEIVTEKTDQTRKNESGLRYPSEPFEYYETEYDNNKNNNEYPPNKNIPYDDYRKYNAGNQYYKNPYKDTYETTAVNINTYGVQRRNEQNFKRYDKKKREQFYYYIEKGESKEENKTHHVEPDHLSQQITDKNNKEIDKDAGFSETEQDVENSHNRSHHNINVPSYPSNTDREKIEDKKFE